MVTTTSIVVSDDDTSYYGPIYGSDSANGYLTQAATVSGGDDSVFLGGYGYNGPDGQFDVNDTILVTGVNDYIGDYGYKGLINAQGATGFPELYVYGADDTILGSGANDYIVSEGYALEVDNGSVQSVSGATHTVGGNAVYVIGNFLYGGAGDDDILMGTADTVYGGQGNDSIDFEYSVSLPTVLAASDVGAFVSADAGNDTVDMSGSLGYDTVYGGDGDDTIYSSDAGNEKLYGQAGNDSIFSSGGNDYIFGGQGNDHIVVTGGGDNFISGDKGNDFVDLSASGGGDNTVYGGDGDDTILGSTGTDDQLYGQAGNDTITLNGDFGTIYGGAGNDLLSDGGHNDSFISGDTGDDSIFANGANDTLYGGDGNDSILATGGNDLIYGGTGNDIIILNAGNTSANAEIFGGADNDLITVSFSTATSAPVTETLNPNGTSALYDPYTGGTIAANDVVSYTTTSANDGIGFHLLSGDAGNDTIYGGSGGDTFVGGTGSDILTSHRLTATGNDPSAPGYQANGAGTTAASDAGSGTNPENTPTTPGGHTVQHSPAPVYATPSHDLSQTGLADHFVFSNGDSLAASPTNPGTGSDVTAGGGEAGIDHIHGFLLNVTGQEAVFANTTAATETPFINSQIGDDLVFLPSTVTAGSFEAGGYTPTLDTNVFYGTTQNVLTGASVATEQSDYAVAYTYAFGTGGTSAAPTSDAHFAAAVDYIVVDVVDSGTGVTNNGNIFVFDHNGNGVVLDGAGLASAGTNGAFENSQNSGSTGVVSGTDAAGGPLSQTTVNIYH